MVVRSSWAAAAARKSAELCQQHVMRNNTERLSSDHMLELLFCLPLRHLARSLFSFFCLRITSPRRAAAIYYSSSSSSDGYDSRSD